MTAATFGPGSAVPKLVVVLAREVVEGMVMWGEVQRHSCPELETIQLGTVGATVTAPRGRTSAGRVRLELNDPLQGEIAGTYDPDAWVMIEER